MIGKKMLTWIGVGLLSAAAVPAMAVTAKHIATKPHAKVAHGSAKATAGKSKLVAGHLVHAAPVRAQHRVNAAHKVTAIHKTNAAHKANAAHAVHATHKSIGVTSMHSGRTTAVAHKATASAHAAVTKKPVTAASKLTTVKHVTAKAPVKPVTLSAVAPKKSTIHIVAHTPVIKPIVR